MKNIDTVRSITDIELISRLQANVATGIWQEPDPWVATVKWLSPRIRNKLKTRGVEIRDIDDGVQDVFLTLFQTIGRLRELEAFDVYLHRIIQGIARHHRRRHSREVCLDVDTLNVAEPLQRDIEFDDLLRPDLDAAEFKVVVLLYSQGLSRDEVANSLGWTRTKVIRTRNKAVNKIRQRVNRGPSTSTNRFR